MLATECYQTKNKTINKHQNLTQKMLNEKMNSKPNQDQISYCQKNLNEIKKTVKQDLLSEAKKSLQLMQNCKKNFFYLQKIKTS